MRPVGIVGFERLFILSLLIGIVQCVLGWNDAVVVIGSAAVVLTIEILIGILALLLVFFISRRRSNVAKWIMIGIFLIGLPGLFHLLIWRPVNVSVLLSVIQVVLEGIALGLLFNPSARSWFRARPSKESGAAGH
jgi:hypothetical protein